MSLNMCIHGIHRPDKEWPDGSYDVTTMFMQLMGPVLLSGNCRHEILELGGRCKRMCVVEMRGDWVWRRQLLNFSTGWASHELCHHCLARRDNFLVFPSQLRYEPRRTSDQFYEVCRADSTGRQSCSDQQCISASEFLMIFVHVYIF